MQASSRTITNWINWINAEGSIDILRNKNKSGRNTTLNESQMDHLKAQKKLPDNIVAALENAFNFLFYRLVRAAMHFTCCIIHC